MGPKRAPDSSDLHLASKLPKLEHGIALTPLTPQHAPASSDFSSSVKKKLQSSSRTGQACDRCKVRKIRCDGRPEGCSPCAQNRTPCKTTDRITGRATIRGHAEALEADNNYLRAQLAELHAQLKELGVEPRAVPNYSGYHPSQYAASGGSDWGDAAQRRSSMSPLEGYAPASGVGNTEYRPLPQFKPGSVGDNYLGVSGTASLPSQIKGTSLSVFGTEIDIADLVQSEADYDKSVMSYDHFMTVILGEDKTVEKLDFPEYQDLKDFAMWYFRSLNPYTMLLDRPTFMKLIWRIWHEPDFKPSPAETVTVHMMLATLKYQIAARNGKQDGLMQESHKHYRYALTFFGHLMHGHRWQDVQAFAMICHHMRNFPKPGAAWIMTSTTFSLAVELGLHRSCKAWADSGKMDTLEIEMRKRVFWTLHALATNLCGKLGRPMPISIEDIDQEFPEPVDDSLPGDDAARSSFSKCSFQVGIQTVKYAVWSSRLYRTVYAVRQSPRGYEDAVRRLEAGIQSWREEIPTELKDPSRASEDNYIFALYLEFWELEFQLLLHHPAVCRSANVELINANLDTCLATAQKMLHNSTKILKMHSLDIPWINTVVYIAAIFTTLFICDQRKAMMSLIDLNKLKSDMSQWLDVMDVCGGLLRTGDKLKKAVQNIVEHSLSSINDSIVQRAATESLAQVKLQPPPNPSSSAAPGNGNTYDQYQDPNVTSAETTLATSAAAYAGIPTTTSFPYSNGASASVQSYPQASSVFDPTTYSSGEDAGMTPSHAAALAAAAGSNASTQRANGVYLYANPQPGSNTFQAHYNGVTPNDWHQWSRENIQQLAPPGDYMNSATTLLALGGRDGGSQGLGQDDPGGVDGSVMQGPSFNNYQWPAVAFNAGSNVHVGQQ